ncbi:hypothetical protein TTHERM_00348010 (macronuclear) [Tetrahymena thermophila SB210]|uniref:Uncharacterized protein n=1 Tax=Tetrahymena thermophila (strain SB210) TaxID=312017 RepID=I7LWR5_TETTS|nr:hypothetical protein TTHERM_00348010 [Tetrahymena thermophila SB210]EAS02711.1 hypothetical protein TTHERM_00348010 [Tetrahymena thermophila SB210]|eukprot:XP_001022956.1 hypothetical protein TTHERM_00348010 [Tetrahymena thermophila SB210]
MITFLRQKEELPNYETLQNQEPNTDKMLNNCKIFSRCKKEIIDTSQIQRKYRWQGSIPHVIRDVNLNLKNDPKNIFRSRNNSCNNSMLSTQRGDNPLSVEKMQGLKTNDFFILSQTKKHSVSNWTSAVMTQAQNSPERKQNDRPHLQQTHNKNSQYKETSLPVNRNALTEIDDNNQKSVSIKYIGVHNDVIGILSRKVPIKLEREKIQLYLKNKDSRKCKSRQSSRQSTCPTNQTFYASNQFAHNNFSENNQNQAKQQQHFKNQFGLQEQCQQRISLKQYEDFVSQMTNQIKSSNQENQQEKKLVYSSLQQHPINQNNNNYFQGSINNSSESTPLQTRFSPYQKRELVDESLRQSTEQSVALNQNYMLNTTNQFQKRCITETSNQKSPINTSKMYDTDYKQRLNLEPITPVKQVVQQEFQQNGKQQTQMALQHMQFKPKRAKTSQSRRMETFEKEEIVKQIQKIQNQKYKEYMQDNLKNNRMLYDYLQNQNTSFNGNSSPHSQSFTPTAANHVQGSTNYQNISFIPEYPEPNKYDVYVINKYSISKRLKPVIKQKENIQKLNDISNVQVEWVNKEKKITYY